MTWEGKMKDLFLIKDLFYKELEYDWELIRRAPGRQKFLVIIKGPYVVTYAAVSIFYAKCDTARVRFFTDDKIDAFTDTTLYSMFGDLSWIVHHYGGPDYKNLLCKATFGRKTRNYGWPLNRVIKNGGVR